MDKSEHPDRAVQVGAGGAIPRCQSHQYSVGLFGLCFILVTVFSVTALAEDVWFDHEGHRERTEQNGGTWRCNQCHVDNAAGDSIRPASMNHLGCNAEGCHVKAFYTPDQPKRPMCGLCHTNDQPWEDMRSLKPFPSTDEQTRTYCIKFDHRKHLAQEGLGRHSCSACHKLNEAKTTYVRPNHGDCMGCHTQDHSVPMSACDQCHTMGNSKGAPIQCSPTVPWRSRQLAARFSHNTHRIDIRKPGSPQLSCGHCHRGVHRSRSVRKIQLMHGFNTMERACAPCHNGRTKVPGTKRRVFSTTEQCSKCHGGKFAGMGAPGNH